MDLNYFNKLTDDNLLEIALRINAVDISKYSQVNKKFNKLIRDNWFWYLKLESDYGHVFDYNKDVDWLNMYQNYATIRGMGHNYHGQLGLDKSNDVKRNDKFFS